MDARQILKAWSTFANAQQDAVNTIGLAMAEAHKSAETIKDLQTQLQAAQAEINGLRGQAPTPPRSTKPKKE